MREPGEGREGPIMKEKCRETLAQVYLFLDGERLSEAERREIKRHLEECGPCDERYGVDHHVTLLVARLQGRARCPQSLKLRITTLLRG
jgi:mycothiol system anti-sigma-R factor